ncbi:MAG: GNAT family N-acetyltransferase [Myxococcota bacterium]
MAAVREGVRADLSWLVGAVMRLNAAGTAADPRFRFVADVEPILREHLGHVWFGRFQPFPAVWIAEVDGERVAMLSGEIVPDAGLLEQAPTARIDNLWVEPPHRRAGLGRELVAAFRARAERAGYPGLQVSTLARDARAVAFWEAMGLSPLRVVLARDDGPEAP